MEPGNTIARMIAAGGGFALLVVLPTTILIPRLELSRIMTVAAFLSAAAIILCLCLAIFAMLWGLQTDWDDRAKNAIFLAAAVSIPACIGAIVIFVSGILASAGGGARVYVIAVGILGLVLFALPALVFFVMAMPGKP